MVVKELVEVVLAIANGLRCGLMVVVAVPVGEVWVGRNVLLVDAVDDLVIAGVAMRLGECESLHRSWRQSRAEHRANGSKLWRRDSAV